jgi:hypothetical protein
MNRHSRAGLCGTTTLFHDQLTVARRNHVESIQSQY